MYSLLMVSLYIIWYFRILTDKNEKLVLWLYRNFHFNQILHDKLFDFNLILVKIENDKWVDLERGRENGLGNQTARGGGNRWGV